MSLFTMSAFATPPNESALNTQFINQLIEVGAGQTKIVDIPLAGNRLESIKLCLSFDGPKKNVQAKGNIPNIWFGSVSSDCTSLDQIGGVDLPEDAILRLSCHNFDDGKRLCRVKAVVYTRNNIAG